MTTTAQQPLTPRQADVLRVIRDCISAQGVSPTLQEIADTLGMSKVSAYEHVGQLEAKGWIRKRALKERSIELLDDPKLVAMRFAIDELRDLRRSAKNPGRFNVLIDRLQEVM